MSHQCGTTRAAQGRPDHKSSPCNRHERAVAVNKGGRQGSRHAVMQSYTCSCTHLGGLHCLQSRCVCRCTHMQVRGVCRGAHTWMQGGAELHTHEGGKCRCAHTCRQRGVQWCMHLCAAEGWGLLEHNNDGGLLGIPPPNYGGTTMDVLGGIGRQPSPAIPAVASFTPGGWGASTSAATASAAPTRRCRSQGHRAASSPPATSIARPAADTQLASTWQHGSRVSRQQGQHYIIFA